jgi:hypothetical protein
LKTLDSLKLALADDTDTIFFAGYASPRSWPESASIFNPEASFSAARTITMMGEARR